MGSAKKPLIVGQFSCDEFEYLKDNIWDFTEKIDGESTRIKWNGDKFKFGGRTDTARMHPSLVAKLKEIFIKDKFIDKFGKKQVIVYGEGYGGSMDKGRKYSGTEKFTVFDINIAGYWLDRVDVIHISNNLGMEYVPLIGQGTLDDAVKLAQSKFKSQFGDFVAEGIVARPQVRLTGNNGDRIITKIKCCDNFI